MALRCFRNPRTGRTLSSVNGASLSHMRYMSEHSSSVQEQAPYVSHQKYYNRRRTPIIGPYNEQCDTKIGIFRYWPGLTTYGLGQSKRCTPFFFKKSRTAHVTSCISVRLSSVSRLFFFLSFCTSRVSRYYADIARSRLANAPIYIFITTRGSSNRISPNVSQQNCPWDPRLSKETKRNGCVLRKAARA